MKRVRPSSLLPLLLLLQGPFVSAQLMLYRQLPEFALSSLFQVEVQMPGTSFQEVFTYEYSTGETGIVTQNEHFAPFAFEPTDGLLTIRVSSKNGTLLNEANFELVNQTEPDVEHSFVNGACVITCASARKQLLLRSPANKANPLLLFVDPMKERPIPNGANVVTFAASATPYVQTAQYDRYEVPNEVDVIYIEDGAMIKGTIHTTNGRNKPLIVMGRGVILGNGPVVNGSQGIPYNTLELNNGNNHVLEGITVIKSRHFALRMSSDGRINNVKILGYNANNDGIVAGTQSIIENCFLKVNDDFIKLYNNDMVVRNCRFYAQTNGAIFQFAWNSITPGSNCLVENCEVLDVEYGFTGDPANGQGGIARAFISLRETNASPVSGNNVFRNILIQGQLKRFMGINGKYGSSQSLTLQNIKLENITVVNKPELQSWVYTGNAPDIVSFEFVNVTFGGVCVDPVADFKTEGNVVIVSNCLPTPVEDQLDRGSIRMYPNPAEKYLRVEMDQPSNQASIQIFELSGRMIHTEALQQEQSVSVSHVPPGLYLVEVSTHTDRIRQPILFIQ